MSRDFETWNNEPAAPSDTNPRSVDRMPVEVYARSVEAERRRIALRKERIQGAIVVSLTLLVIAVLVYAAFSG